MIVTGIEIVTKQKYKVELDAQLAFILYKSELSRYRIKKDRELSEDIYREIIEVLTKRAKKYVMHLLTKTDKTEYELAEKLRKSGYPDEVMKEAIAYVKSYRYVDDERYVRNYMDIYGQKMSRKQIVWKLSAKGIKKEIIDLAFEGEEIPDESKLILQHIQKKTKNKTSLEDKEIKSLGAYLYRKGFQSSVIWEALNQLKSENSGYYEE